MGFLDRVFNQGFTPGERSSQMENPDPGNPTAGPSLMREPGGGGGRAGSLPPDAPKVSMLPGSSGAPLRGVRPPEIPDLRNRPGRMGI